MSTHKVEVVKIYQETHPNGDKLALVKVHGWQIIVGKDEFSNGDLGIYVAPDYVIPIEPNDFAKTIITPSILEMLARNCKVVDARHSLGEGYIKGFRIKVKKFRGEWSQGLLLAAPAGIQEGDDVMALLGMGHYEPPIETTTSGEADLPPEIPVPKFDVESFAQFNTILKPTMQVTISEKVHGAQARFLYDRVRFHAGSKNEWKKESPNSLWWRALEKTRGLKEWLQANPGMVVYGEIYGSGVQDLSYGLKNRDIKCSIFDIWSGNRFLPYDLARTLSGRLLWVPELYRGPYDEMSMKKLVDGSSCIPNADHLREGIVIRTLDERTEPTFGRIIFKVVSNAYLERS